MTPTKNEAYFQLLCDMMKEVFPLIELTRFRNEIFMNGQKAKTIWAIETVQDMKILIEGSPLNFEDVHVGFQREMIQAIFQQLILEKLCDVLKNEKVDITVIWSMIDGIVELSWTSDINAQLYHIENWSSDSKKYMEKFDEDGNLKPPVVSEEITKMWTLGD